MSRDWTWGTGIGSPAPIPQIYHFLFTRKNGFSLWQKPFCFAYDRIRREWGTNEPIQLEHAHDHVGLMPELFQIVVGTRFFGKKM